MTGRTSVQPANRFYKIRVRGMPLCKRKKKRKRERREKEAKERSRGREKKEEDDEKNNKRAENRAKIILR